MDIGLYVRVFLVGGLICMFVQFLLDYTKLMPGRTMVLLVVTGAILGAFGLYKPLVDFASCGATVPLSGFGYNLAKGVKEAVDKDGVFGIFLGGMQAAAGGTTAALVFSYLAAQIFQPKIKK